MVTKHVKPRRQGEQGGIVKAEGAMYASKVMPICPKCGKGQMQFYGKVVRCYNPECGLHVFRQKANRDLKDEEIKELLTTGKTALLKGFKSKQGKSFDAIIAFDADYNTVFVFPEVKNKGKHSPKRK